MNLEPVEKINLGWLKFQRNRPEIMNYCRQPYLLSMGDQEAWLERCKDRSVIPLIVKDDNSDSCGYVSLSGFDWVSRCAEFSIFIIPEFQKMGIGPKAMRLLLDYGFNTLGLQKIHGECFDYNLRGIKFFQDIGFKTTGKLVRHYFKNGKLIDAVIISILVEDYREAY